MDLIILYVIAALLFLILLTLIYSVGCFMEIGKHVIRIQDLIIVYEQRAVERWEQR